MSLSKELHSLCYDETGGHGGNIKEASKRSGYPERDILDFSSNVNPLGPPPGLLPILRRELNKIKDYPEPQASGFSNYLASSFNLPEERLLPGNGANDLLHLFVLWLRPRRVVVPVPSFAEYHRAARLAESELFYYSLPPGQELNSSDMGDKLREGDLVVFCNPNNPTGKLFPREEVVELVQRAEKQGATILLDESFMPLSGSSQEESLQNLNYSNLWVLVSLTKVWALPGLRLGYLVGPPPEINLLKGFGDPWRVNALSQKAGIYCLDVHADYLQKTLRLIEKERNYLHRALQKTEKFRVYESMVNFLLVEGKEHDFDASHLQEYLVKQGVLIRNASNFGWLDSRHWRIAVKSRKQNRKLIQAVLDYIKHY